MSLSQFAQFTIFIGPFFYSSTTEKFSQIVLTASNFPHNQTDNKAILCQIYNVYSSCEVIVVPILQSALWQVVSIFRISEHSSIMLAAGLLSLFCLGTQAQVLVEEDRFLTGLV